MARINITICHKLPTQPSLAQTSSGTVNSTSPCLTPPDTINVQLEDAVNLKEFPGKSLHDVISISFEDWVYGVVMGELDPTQPFSTVVWNDNVIKAQAIAARTWGSHWCKCLTLSNGSKGVYNTDPSYRPNYDKFDLNVAGNKQRYINLSNTTQGLYLSYEGDIYNSPYNGKLMDAQWRKDVGNPSCSWNSGDTRVGNVVYSGCLSKGDTGLSVSGYDYLRKVNNPYFTSGGWLGPGFGQRSAQGFAIQNQAIASWYQLLMHYYSSRAWVVNKQPTYTAQYWNNTTLSGSANFINNTNSINYDWGTNGSPDSRPGQINATNFSARWSATANFGTSDWTTFYIFADDGFRLYIDGALILDKWFSPLLSHPNLYSVAYPKLQGNHVVRLDYFQGQGGAVARLFWTPDFGMVGTYYNRIRDPFMFDDIGGETPPLFTRPDTVMAFDWQNYSALDTCEPGFGPLNSDNFSINWTGYLYIPICRKVAVETLSDDGVRMGYYNGNNITKMIDQWNNHGPTTHLWNGTICAGTYELVAGYYENAGFSTIRLKLTTQDLP